MQKIIYIFVCCFIWGCTDVKTFSNNNVQPNQNVIDSINQNLYFLLPSFLKEDYFEAQRGKEEVDKIQNKVTIIQSVYRTYPDGLYKLPSTFFQKENIKIFSFEPFIAVNENKLSPINMWIGDFYYENHLISNVLKISEIITAEKVISITDVYMQLPKHLAMNYTIGGTTDIQSDFHTLFINGKLVKNMDSNHKINFIKNLEKKGYKIPLAENIDNKIKIRTDSIAKYSKKVLVVPR